MRLEAQVAQLVKTGGDEKTYSRGRYLVETIELHHEIFSIIQDAFNDRRWVSYNDEDDGSKPFHEITGQAEFVDFNKLANFTRQFPDLGKNFAAATGGVNPAADIKNTKNTAYLIDAFYKDVLGIMVSLPEFAATAYLREDCLTSPFPFLVDNYGRHTQVKVSLFGLKVGKGYPKDETSGETTFFDSDDPSNPSKRLSGMAGSLMNLNRSLEGMDRFYRVRGDAHLYPLAIYVDFDTKGT